MNKKDVKQKIKQLAGDIMSITNPEKIILFGSFVWGDFNTNSDIDICVIESSQDSRRARQLKLRQLLLDFDLPADILSYTPDEIKKRLELNDFFVKDIINKGEVIYERSSGEC